MKNLYHSFAVKYSFFSLIFIALSLTSHGQVMLDTLSNYPWELMETPAHNVTSFAKSGNRMFAGSEYGLFFSDDEGLNWERHSAFENEKIMDLVATDLAIFVTIQYPLTYSIPYTINSMNEIYVSWDGGETFVLNQTAVTGVFHYGSNGMSKLITSNDSTFAMAYHTANLNNLSSDLYGTTNAGQTWDTIQLNNNGTFASNNDELFFFAENGDTIYIHAFAPNNFTISAVDTVVKPANINFDYYKTYWKTSNSIIIIDADGFYVKTEDNGLTWETDTINFSGEYIVNFENIGEELLASGSGKIFRFFENNFPDYEVIYEGQNEYYQQYNSTSNGITTTFKTDEKYYCGDFGGIYSAENEDFNWQKSNVGITNAAITLTNGSCNNVGNQLWFNALGGNYRLSSNEDEWELLIDSIMLIGGRVVAEFDGVIFAYDDGWVYRSFDNGENWELYPEILSTSYHDRMKTYQTENRLFLYDYSGIFYTENQGESWENIDIPYATPNYKVHFFARQDSFFLFLANDANSTNLTRYFSEDAGINWQPLSLGNSSFNGGQMFEQGNILYHFRENMGFSYSEDWGITWIENNLTDFLPFYANLPYYDAPTELVGIFDDLALVHAGKQLWATTDYGQNWTIINDLPFIKEYVGTVSTSYYNIPVEGGTRYVSLENDLYIFTEGWGVWRTPIANLTAAMNGSFAYSDLELSISAPTDYKIYEPIPYQITIENTGTLAATDIKINSALPAGLVFTSSNATAGDFNLYYEDWTIPELAAGESATLDLVLFPLINDAPVSLFAQITAASPEDWDSTPNNNVDQIQPNEDDEAIATSYPMMPLVNALNSTIFETQIFPNPTTRMLNVHWNFNNENVENVQIVDIRGQVLQTILVEKSSFGNIEMEVGNLETGVYFLQIQTDERMVVERFVKK